MADAVLAIDIGGTKLAAGVVDAAGTMRARTEVPTRAAEGLEPVLGRIIDLGRETLARAEGSGLAVQRIGVGCAGPVDRQRGMVRNPPNLPGWEQVPLRERIRAVFGLPTILENDANAAALGEYRYGAGRGAGSLVYYTVSTGIGGGIVLGGRLWHGFADAAGEVGHMTVQPDGPRCGCGNRGCLEAVASGPSMVRRAREALQAGRTSRLGSRPDFTARELAAAVREGDELAAEIWSEAVRCLGIGVAAVINILAPERIVIGGGISRAGDLLFAPLRDEVRRRVKLPPLESIPILPAALGPDVGILGAAAVALDG
ncbi:MAG: ROK family protein [Candidatus Methylomirabilota bacterium]